MTDVTTDLAEGSTPEPKGVPQGRKVSHGTAAALSETVRSPQGSELIQVIEAILFVGNEPLNLDRIATAFPNVSQAMFVDAIGRLGQRYQQQNRPYQIRRTPAGYVLELQSQFRDDIRSRSRTERGVKLPRAVIEVLSLIAYRQPIDKEQIVKLLGYDATGPLRQLTRRGLIEKGAEGEGTGSQYVTTPRFLNLFNIESLDELPSSEELS